jgi:hypothetical protein
VVWQLSQELAVIMCPAVLPGAVVPLWQVPQDPWTAEWSIFAGMNPCVLWQESQLIVDKIWFAGFPGALLPLWHALQEPLTELWSICTGVHPLFE